MKKLSVVVLVALLFSLVAYGQTACQDCWIYDDAVTPILYTNPNRYVEWVGIGKTNPSYTLDVNGVVAMTGFLLPTGAANGYVLTSNGGGYGSWQPPSWAKSGSDIYRTTGNVGIGMTDPDALLHLGSNTSGANKIRLGKSGAGPHGIDFMNSNNTVGMSIYYRTGPQKLYIEEGVSGGKLVTFVPYNGNVGIGMTDPESKLHVECNSAGPLSPEEKLAAIYGYNTSTDISYANAIGVYGKVRTSNGRAIYGYSTNADGYGGYFVGKGYFSGNVGIGTTNPTGKLEVKGDLNVSAGSDNDADIILTDASGKFGWIAQDDQTNAMWVEHAEGQKLMLSGQYAEDGIVVVKGILGVGTDEPQSELAVNGTITAKEVIVTTDGFPDFVFTDNYNLIPLDKLEKHVKVNKSLPGIPTEKEVLEGGVNLGEMQAKLLEKVEELTLYVIELKKENIQLKKQNDNLETRISALEK